MDVTELLPQLVKGTIIEVLIFEGEKEVFLPFRPVRGLFFWKLRNAVFGHDAGQSQDYPVLH